jgi:hypothetical protein
MKSGKSSLLLCRGLISSIGVLMIGFLALGVRAFATVGATELIFFAVFVTSAAIVALYFIFRRPARKPAAHSPFLLAPVKVRRLRADASIPAVQPDPVLP